MKKIILLMQRKAPFSEIMGFTLLIVCVFLLAHVFISWYENWLKPQTDVDVYQGLYEKLYEKAQNADMGCYEDNSFYDKYMMALEDADKRLTDTIDNVWAVLIGGIAVIVSWIMLLRIDKWIILFLIAPFIGNFVFATALNKIVYKIFEETVIYKRIADYVNRMVHLSDYAKDLRLTNIFRVMQRKHTRSVEETTRIIDSYKKKSILCGWANLFLTYTAVFEGILFYGVYRTLISQSMTFADFTVLSSLMVAVSSVLIDFTEAVISSYRNSFFIANLRAFLEFTPSIPEDYDGIQPGSDIEEIEFRNVSFSYKNGKPILKNISFQIKKETTCALVGFNGAGKTTIIKLLLRLYDPTQGEILVNGTNIKEYNLKAYRELFAMAFQDGKIFARSIKDNVLIQSKTDMDDSRSTQKTWEALKLAGIDEYVKKLPHQLDSILTKEFDEEGVVMSGGQYQKIMAARAFASERPVLVFDEPSSALDPIAEYYLFQSIAEAKKGRILFFISHRLSSAQNAQQILLLENGRIVERGSHKQLMDENGKYAMLYRTQARNYQAQEEKDWVSNSIFTQHMERK